ncbi:FAD-dependent oxidoreductase [Legionella genomosp. 1]|uniref:FAD-dependent oxidoreductase n=1 Tax=Legionella genomosp. 1 TaxID=1093625 RepID=UPI0010553332|nr:FAD-dependent oxidoreductase [Legionella genomosp. 1]
MDGISMWNALELRSQPANSLAQDLDVEIAIVGAGITGITTALYLINAGKKVAILEADQIGGYTTSRSTGNLYTAVQPLYQQIEKNFDLETAKAVAQARQTAIQLIETNVNNEQLDCNFSRRPWYGYSNGPKKSILDNEVGVFSRMGIGFEEASELPFPFPFQRAIVMPNQARFNPLRYVRALADKLQKAGCMIFENTRVLSIEEDPHPVLYTSHNQVRAEKVILATHTPIGVHAIQTFTAPYRSYVCGFKMPESLCPEGHLWNFDSHHVLSTHSGDKGNRPQIVLISGAHHKTGQEKNPEKHYIELESDFLTSQPEAKLAYRWSAQHYQSADAIPYIGFTNKKTQTVLMATGYFADGLIYGSLAGLILANLIIGKDNELNHLFKADRKASLASLPSFFKENMNVLNQYLSDLPQIKQPLVKEIRMGEGKIIEMDRAKFAVSRDANNQLHVVSAVCPHMKCIVDWNHSEQTWDCPCHGSRFSPDGQVLEGPAMQNLPVNSNFKEE